MRLHVHDWGVDDAPPLLCLHGVTSWGGRFRRLADERLVLLDPAVWVPPQVALERAELTREDESYASLDEAVEARLAANPRAKRDFVADEVPHHMRLGDD